MVALAQPTRETVLSTAPRARGRDRRHISSASSCSKSKTAQAFGERRFARRIRLGTCSNGPFRYDDGWNTFSYVRDRPAVLVDPLGLAGIPKIGGDDHRHPPSSPYCGINFYEENFWSNDRVWLMDHLGYDWRVQCDGSKADVWKPMLSWDISWRPKWLSWGCAGYSHRIDDDFSSRIEDIDCYSCGKKREGNLVKLKVKLSWVLYEWWGVGSIPRTPIDFPPFVGGSKETELWSIELTAECKCCQDPQNSVPKPCSSGECKG